MSMDVWAPRYHITVTDYGYGMHEKLGTIHLKKIEKHVLKNLTKLITILSNNLPCNGVNSTTHEKLDKFIGILDNLKTMHSYEGTLKSYKNSAPIAALFKKVDNLIKEKMSKLGVKVVAPPAVNLLNSLAKDPQSRFSELPRDIVDYILNPMVRTILPIWHSIPQNEVISAAQELGYRGEPGEAIYFLSNLARYFVLFKDSYPKYCENLLGIVFIEGDIPIIDRDIVITDLLTIRKFFKLNPQKSTFDLLSPYKIQTSSSIEVIEFIQAVCGVSNARDYIPDAVVKHDWARFKRLLTAGISHSLNNVTKKFRTPLGEVFNDSSLNKNEVYELCELIMLAGGDPNIPYNKRGTSLSYALRKAIDLKDEKLANLFLDFGAFAPKLRLNEEDIEWLKDLQAKRAA